MGGRKRYGHDAAERKVIELIRLKARTRRGGWRLGPGGIARELNEEGCKSRDGKIWRAETVKRILARVQDTARMRPVKKSSLGSRDYLTAEQLAGVIAACQDDRERVIIKTLAGSGLRASELCALRVRDVQVVPGRAMIDVLCGKGSRRRTVAIPERLGQEIMVWAEKRRGVVGMLGSLFCTVRWEPLTYASLYSTVRGIGRWAGLPELHPHVFRHTFATMLYEVENDLIFVRDQLGHSSLTTTGIYARSVGIGRYRQVEVVGTRLSGDLLAQTT